MVEVKINFLRRNLLKSQQDIDIKLTTTIAEVKRDVASVQLMLIIGRNITSTGVLLGIENFHVFRALPFGLSTACYGRD